LTARRGCARVLDVKGPGNGLILLRDIPHPEGKLKRKGPGSDEPGRSFEREVPKRFLDVLQP